MSNKLFTLITGASEGFGKALSLECAHRNMNLILVSLPGSGLHNLACYIERNYRVKVVCFEHDLSIKEECFTLFQEVSRLKLKVNRLINNAGMGGTHFFDERNAEYYCRQIELNVVAPTLITHLFLEMLESYTPSHILNVSSLASFFYLPKKQVYGGTKSYLVSFSKSLRRELIQKNIYVSVVCPGGMNTNAALTVANLSQRGFNRWSIMNPEEVAKITIDKMFRKKEVIIPGKWNRFFIILDHFLPTFIKEWITQLVMKKTKVYQNPVTPLITTLKTAV